MKAVLEMNNVSGIADNDQILAVYHSLMPVYVFVGLTGNTLVWILIRSNRILSKLPSNIYLLALAAMSSSFLISLFIFWLEECIIKAPITRDSIVLCKLLNFLAHFGDFSSVWLIVLVGFERLILLYKAKRSMTKQRAQRHVCLLLAIALIFNSWVLICAGIQDGQCDIDARFGTLYSIFAGVEIGKYKQLFGSQSGGQVLCMALPSVLIILSNVLVVFKLHSHLKRIPSSPTVSFNTADLVSAAPSHSAKSAMLSR